MFKQAFAVAAIASTAIFTAQAEVTPVLTPAPGDAVTDLASITVTFDGLEILTKPTMSTVSATLVNETTGTSYKAVDVKFSFMTPNAATLKFGVEGTSTALSEIKEDGTYKLSVAAGSFKCENVAPTYYSPVIEATYVIGAEPKDNMTDYVLTPGAGAVTEINTIDVNFPGTGFMGIQIASTDGITLTYTRGMTQRVAKVVKTDYSWGSNCGLQFDWEDATVDEPMTFLAPGDYTLDIPEGAFKEFGGTAVNRPIHAVYTIAAQGGAMSSCSLTPAAGEVNELTNVDINFGGNEVSNLEWGSDLSAITITRKGEMHTVWHCISASGLNNSSVRLSFARENSTTATAINAPGEYLLNVPAGLISGYTSQGRKSNDAIQALYTIITGVNNMRGYILTPGQENVAELKDIVLSFPRVADGVTLPAENNITLVFTPEEGGADEVTYAPRGCQINGNEVTIVFGNADNEAFTADGTYRLTVPEGTFGEFGNSSSVSPLIEMTYVIDNVETGISGITVEDGSAAVYNLHGMIVRRAGDSRQLPAGIYISNGKKLVVK